MKNVTFAATALCALSMQTAFAEIDRDGRKVERIEQRWYSVDEIAEKRIAYGRVPLDRGFMEFYWEGEDYVPDAPMQELGTILNRHYSTHDTVGTHHKNDYAMGLDRACVDVTSTVLRYFVGDTTQLKHPKRKEHKRYVTGITPLTYKGAAHNYKSNKSWEDTERATRPERSVLCEIYEVENEAGGHKYVVYSGIKVGAQYDELYRLPQDELLTD